MLHDPTKRHSVLVEQTMQEKDHTMGCQSQAGEREVEEVGQEEEI